MRTRGLQITSLLVASPVVLILISLIIILLVSICSQLRIWISALAASIGFSTKSASKVLTSSSTPSYHGMATNQFASLDSKTIASVDKISLNAPGSSSAWMHRLSQYLRMMPLRFAASSTILLAIIILICIFAFRIARYKIRGQDAYETCMEKLAEYRIPGTMYINTKKFHEFLKATDRQPPTVRRWQLSKDSSSSLSEANLQNDTALPTHNQPADHSMLRVHRTGLTRPRSRSNGSSMPHGVPIHHAKESYDQTRRSDLDEKSVSRNNSFTNPFLSEHRKQNVDLRCNQSIVHDRQEAKLSSSANTEDGNKVFSSTEKSLPTTTTRISVTADNIISIPQKVDAIATSEVLSHVEDDDSQEAFVQVERKKRKKTKALMKQTKIQQLPPRVELHELTKPTVDHVVEYGSEPVPEPTVLPELEIKPVPDHRSQPESDDAWIPEEQPGVQDNSKQDTFSSPESVEEPKLTPPTVTLPLPTSTTPPPPTPGEQPINQTHQGAWYSPFSSGLQLDILPRPQSPLQPAYNSVTSYGPFSGITINHRKHYQQSSLPYISRATSPRSLVGRERLPERPYFTTPNNSVYSTDSVETPYGMERRRWRGMSSRTPDRDPEAYFPDSEFSLFDKKLPSN